MRNCDVVTYVCLYDALSNKIRGGSNIDCVKSTIASQVI